jgi:A/G-specific adenine glycosylase
MLSIHDGKVPSDAGKLKEIPGFGPYTLAAVLSIAFHKPVAVVDANVRRVVLRLAAIKETPGSGFDLKIQNSLSGIISLKRPGDFNQAMMELGATVCRSKEPVCNLCPVRKVCLAFKAGIQETIPQPKTTETIDIKAVVGLIINNKKEIFIQKRPEKGLLAGLWEFPGGKVETGESLTTALKRELKEELDLNPEDLIVGQELCSVTHYYTKFRVRLTAFCCKTKKGACLVTTNEGQWVKLSRMAEYPMPSGSAKILDHLGSPEHASNFL